MTTTTLLNTLYVQTPGSHVSLDGDAVRAYLAGSDTWRRLPLARIESIVLIGAVTATTDLLLRCADDGRPVSWLSEFGRPRATVHPPISSRGSARAAQHAAHTDGAHRARLAHTIVMGKLANMRTVLRRAAHDAKGHDHQALRTAIERTSTLIDDESRAVELRGEAPTRARSLGIEGAASRYYFTGLRHSLHPDPAIAVPPTRTNHPATDPVNATMSFAYALTLSAVLGSIHSAGLDPAIGYLHGDRDGQPSLALDLMEELRPGADRVVTTLFNRRQLRAQHFAATASGAVHLTEDGRRVLFAACHEHRQATSPHQVLGHDVPNGLIPHVQARLLVRHLTGDTSDYIPFRQV